MAQARRQEPALGPAQPDPGTDRVDAEVIARYGAFARPAATPAPDAAGRELAELLAFRQRPITGPRSTITVRDSRLVRKAAARPDYRI